MPGTFNHALMAQPATKSELADVAILVSLVSRDISIALSALRRGDDEGYQRNIADLDTRADELSALFDKLTGYIRHG